MSERWKVREIGANAFTNDIYRILRDNGMAEGIKEIRRHASVSTRNNHYCKACFCCACVDYLKRADALKKEFEARGGNLDPNGPELTECEHCGGVYQYVDDHECWGTRAEAGALRRQAEMEGDWYDE